MPGQEKSKPSPILPNKTWKDGSKIIAGLGNPDKKFENTYHNVGVMALSEIARKDENAPLKFKSRKGLFEYTKTSNGILVKPLIFMNESGKAIALAARDFHVRPENIIIIHDDS